MTPRRLRALLLLLAAAVGGAALAAARGRIGATGDLPPADTLLVGAGQRVLWILGVYVVAVLAAASALVLLGRPSDSVALLRVVPAAVRPLLAAFLGIAVTAGPAAAATPAPTPSRATPGPVAALDRLATADPFDWAAPSDALARIDAAVEPAPATAAPVLRRAPPRTFPTRTVRVAAGECLWSLAARDLAARHVGSRPADVAVAWRRWYALNRATIGPDPGLIRPGQVLRIPPPNPSANPSTRMTRRHP